MNISFYLLLFHLACVLNMLSIVLLFTSLPTLLAQHVGTSQIPFLLPPPLDKQAPAKENAVTNAPQIFNAVHSAMRQWV